MAISASGPRAEVPEDEAQGRVKVIYDEIKATFRVPIVNLVFRVLATDPDYLQLAWRQLKPNAQTVFFEGRADDIRQRAVEVMAAFGQAPSPPEDAVATLAVFHYVNPKLLLAVAALRAASKGQYPQLEELPRPAKRQIEPGVPAGAPAINMVDPGASDPAVSGIFDDIKATLGLDVVNSDYRALAQWPAYFEPAWQSLRPLVDRPEYGQLQRDVRLMAEEAVLIFPFRLEINPHIMRLCGLSEGDIDRIHAELDRFYRLLPGLIANIAYWSVGALGREAAAKTPFPPAVQ